MAEAIASRIAGTMATSTRRMDATKKDTGFVKHEAIIGHGAQRCNCAVVKMPTYAMSLNIQLAAFPMEPWCGDGILNANPTEKVPGNHLQNRRSNAVAAACAKR